jgi:hypothetical protein
VKVYYVAVCVCVLKHHTIKPCCASPHNCSPLVNILVLVDIDDSLGDTIKDVALHCACGLVLVYYTEWFKNALYFWFYMLQMQH